MGDRMRVLPFGQLVERIFQEYSAERSIFGLHESRWYRKADSRTVQLFGEPCETALGPAAGPHTQLAQNIVSAYLTGSRFIELKTVQILDALEIEKPCIDAGDEGYNTEWSTELSLQQAWEEYAKGWILLHLVEELWDLRASGNTRGFMFNMSVGYDLAGIRNPRVQEFIDRMIDSSPEPRFQAWLQEADVRPAALLAGTGLEHKAPELSRLGERISGRICTSVTLSTMHGCPPNEIESICRHLLEERGLDTYVKLNPTLLGFDTVRTILNRLGYDYVTLDPDGFEHDLQYDSAITVLTRLREVAAGAGRRFGVKLTNTLPSVNTGGSLPGDQMYMSGRALYPLSISVAAKLSQEFDGELPISYSGGITIHNVADVFRTGIKPITASTVFLKPGGYTRQVQLARALEELDNWDHAKIDVTALTRLAENAVRDLTAHKEFRGTGAVGVPGELPRFNCYRAPCVSACAIGQHVPEYIRLVGEQRYGEALRLIYARNALPGITGHICDHQCQEVCTRLDYEGCLNIRELKKIAVEHGFDEYSLRAQRPTVTRATKCAVIGAGPAGLAAAYFLAREGFPVTVFEREANAGGVVRNVIPPFRLPVEAIEQDIAFIADHGVEFVFSADPTLTAETLRAERFGPIVLAIGAEVDNEIALEGDRSRVIRSLDFLWAYRGNVRKLRPGPRVVVVGGGNTAMDAARAAITLPGVEEVSVLYRRTEAEMPADREEYHNARADGVRFRFLRNPERIEPNGELSVRVMQLGEPDESGRRRPLATGATETVVADTLITAAGERVDAHMLRRFGVPLNGGDQPSADPDTLETGLAEVYLAGDALTGPSTVVRCIAAGRRAAEAIAVRHGGPAASAEPLPQLDLAARLEQLRERKATVRAKPDPAACGDHRAFAATEYHRCLECSYICNKCEEVCPNRANITVAVVDEGLFEDPFQIVHLDASCNECGNCGQFCPWSARVPYRDKPTVFSTAEDFERSTNEGWLLRGEVLRVRFAGEVYELPVKAGRVDASRRAGTARPVGDTGSRPARAGQTPAYNARQEEARFYRLFDILYHDRPALFAVLTPEAP